MGLDAKTDFIGLVTATGEVSAHRGALRVADNVTLRKEGALTLRPYFTTTTLSRQYRAAYPYKGSLYYIGASNAVYSPAQALLYRSGSLISPAAVRDDIQSAKEARGNLYFASVEGVYKVTSTSDGVLVRAGIAPGAAYISALSVSSPGTGTDLLAAGQTVGYRVVMVMTDPNGVVTRSRPSGMAVVVSTGVQSPYVAVNAQTNSAPAVSRQVELYRTRIFPSTAQLDDELQLVKTWDISTTTSFSALFIDQVPDARRGVTLYTSPSRGGTENANDRPPGCACLERYRGSLFFGNTVSPQRVVLSYTPTTANLVGTSAGIGVRQTTGTTTVGSASITGVANTTGLQVGMRILAATSSWMGQITAISGTTVTSSATATGAQTGGNVWFFDSVVIDGVAVALGIGANAGIAGVGMPVATSGALQDTSAADTTVIYEITPAAAGYGQTIVIERLARGGTPMQIRATHGNEMSPAVPLASQSATSLASTNDVLPNGLAWSEPDEPEHAPPKNFARVGDTGKAILALVATRDRLLIWKEDGLFMLTGDTAKNFGIYPLDTTALCVLPGSVRRLKNTVYGLTNLGLVTIDENGSVTVISRPIQTEVGPIVTAIRQAQKTSGLYLMPGVVGVSATSDDANNEYWLALGTTTPSFRPSTDTAHVLVYNAFRDGFTTFAFGSGSNPGALAQDGEGQPFALLATQMLTLATSVGVVAMDVIVTPHAFSDPALLGKVWNHVVLGFSTLTGTTGNFQCRFRSSETMVDGGYVAEFLELTRDGSNVVRTPNGTLIRHPLPRAAARAAFMTIELVMSIAGVSGGGAMTLEFIGLECRENISNKRPSHGTGNT